MATPVSRISRLLIANPGSGHVRDKGSLWRVQRYLADQCLKWLHDRLNHSRMKRVRGMQAAAANSLLSQSLLDPFYGLIRTGDDR